MFDLLKNAIERPAAGILVAMIVLGAIMAIAKVSKIPTDNTDPDKGPPSDFYP